MSTLPVAHYLRELAPESSRRRPNSEFVVDNEEIEKRLEEARMLGVLEGRAAVQTEFDQRLKAHVAGLEQKFAHERQAWAQDQAQRLSDLIAESVDGMTRDIAEQVARVLRPFVEEAVSAKAALELRSTLEKMLANGDYGRIAISGPQDLVGAMEALLEGRGLQVTFQTTDTADLTVMADETVLETRIGAWVAAIRGEAQ